jgi:hypothetical protein
MAESTDQKVSGFLERMRIAKAPAWMPEPGDVLIGEVIGLSMRDGEYGLYPCVTYQRLDGDGVVNLHAFHTIIRERLAELKTNLTSRHIITYNGTREKTKPNAKGEIESYHDYYIEDFNEKITAPAVAENFTFDV